MNKKITVLFALVLVASMVLAACQPEVITKEVEVPVEVEVIKEVEVPVEVEVEVPVASKTLVFSSRLFSPPREQEFFIKLDKEILPQIQFIQIGVRLHWTL